MTYRLGASLLVFLLSLLANDSRAADSLYSHAFGNAKCPGPTMRVNNNYEVYPDQYVPATPVDPYFKNCSLVGPTEVSQYFSSGYEYQCRTFNSGIAPGSHTLSTLSDSEPGCSALNEAGKSYFSTHLYQKAYDTLRRYVESCAVEEQAADALLQIGAANDQRSDDTLKYVDYREWLKTILYLNESDRFYCGVGDQLLQTLRYHEVRGSGDKAGQLAVLQFLINSNRCPELDYEFSKVYGTTRAQQYSIWRDTVSMDTTAYPFDTTLPSLEDLGLGLLRGKSSAELPKHFESHRSLLGISLLTNPVESHSTLVVEVDRSSSIAISLYNIRGASIPFVFESKSCSLGKNRYDLDFSALESGSYYLRVSTGFGDVQSIKVVRR